MSIVDHYGVHWHEDIAYLHQASGNVTALGAKNRSPFKVRCPTPCRHKLDPTGVLKLAIDPRDPFVEAHSPVPHKGAGVVAIDKKHLPLSRRIAWMSGTNTQGSEIPREVGKTPPGHLKLVREMSSTNVQPLFITGITVADIGFTLRMTQGNWPRRVIFVTEPDVLIPNVPRVVPAFDYSAFSPDEWASHGNWLIREYMLNGPGTP